MRMWAEEPGRSSGYCRLVVSERLIKSRAAYLGKSLTSVNKEAGLSTGYIYKIYGNDVATIGTLNRLARVLQCRPYDLLEIANEKEPVANEAIT